MLRYIIPPHGFRKYKKGFHNGSNLIHVSYKWKKRWKFDLCPVKSNIFMYMNIYSILKSVQLYIKSKNQFKMKILNFVLPEGYFLVLCNDSQRDLLIFSEWKHEIEPTRHMRFQSQQIGPIVIDRAFNLFRVQYKCFVCISINWILHRLGAERVCLNRPLADRWVPDNNYRMLSQLHYKVSTLRIIAMRGLIATQLLRELCVIFFGRMESICFNVFNDDLAFAS